MTGWFVDIDNEVTSQCPYVLVLSTSSGCHQLDGIWFGSQESAYEYLLDEVLDQPALP